MDGYITIGTKLDTSDFDVGLNKLGKSLDGKLNTMSNNISKTFKLLKTAIIGLGIGLIIKSIFREMDDAISRVDTLNNYSKVMKNLGIASEDAEKSIKILSDKLIGLPTTLNDAAMAVQRFTSANGNVKASTEIFLALNNAILAGGADMQIQKSALEQLSQAYAKGKPDMMEWRTAMMAMPAQLKQIAKSMGYVSADKLGEALRNGSVSMNRFMVEVAKLNKQGVDGFESFEEQARTATGGVRTSITNMKTALVRGLADIMNAIGQSNIAGFFNGISKAIGQVIPYISAFVKTVMTAISAIAGVFGRKANNDANKTQNSIKSASESMVGLSDNTKKTNTGLNKAAQNAKKLQKTLAGFDEMNVLQEQNDSSSNGGSSKDLALLGNIDTSAFDTKLTESSNKVDEIYHNMVTKIMRYIEPLKHITLDNLVNSFNKFKEALSEFTGNIFDGLEWFYFNILVPLAKWTIENALPAFFKILSGALKVLNKAIQDLKPIWEWLWKKALKPMAEWTGGIIVTILEAIAGALDWISQNEIAMAILEGVAIAVGSIAAAIALYNAAMIVCNAVTGVFAGIMTLLTSPITLVVLAIGALIAVIILCVKHWDQIKEAAINVWNKIQEIWSNVANWFNDTIIQPISNFFSDMWNGITNGAKNAWEGIKSVFSTVASFFKNIFTNAWEGVKNVFSTGGRIFTGIKEGILESFKRIVNVIIDGINKVVAIPFNGINKAFNNLRGVDLWGWKPFEWVPEIRVPQIPRLAKGGILNNPGKGVYTGTAIAGEAGREFYMPLQDEQMLSLVGESIGRYVTINLTNITELDGRQIARKVDKIQQNNNFVLNR